MLENYLIYGALAVIAVILVVYPVSTLSSDIANVHEHMIPLVPLDAGTFPNDYVQGTCKPANMQRCECSVGNCPIGSFVTNNEYCSIHCAQISDKKTQDECNTACMNVVTDCNEPDLSKCNDYYGGKSAF